MLCNRIEINRHTIFFPHVEKRKGEEKNIHKQHWWARKQPRTSPWNVYKYLPEAHAHMDGRERKKERERRREISDCKILFRTSDKRFNVTARNYAAISEKKNCQKFKFFGNLETSFYSTALVLFACDKIKGIMWNTSMTWCYSKHTKVFLHWAVWASVEWQNPVALNTSKALNWWRNIFPSIRVASELWNVSAFFWHQRNLPVFHCSNYFSVWKTHSAAPTLKKFQALNCLRSFSETR